MYCFGTIYVLHKSSLPFSQYTCSFKVVMWWYCLIGYNRWRQISQMRIGKSSLYKIKQNFVNDAYRGLGAIWITAADIYDGEFRDCATYFKSQPAMYALTILGQLIPLQYTQLYSCWCEDSPNISNNIWTRRTHLFINLVTVSKRIYCPLVFRNR